MGENIQIGVDTGGTFTDFIICTGGKIHIQKIPSTPENPTQAIVKGIEEYLAPGTDCSLFIVHGTTVGANALLEKKGGHIVLITTRCFEEMFLIGRQTRRSLYELTAPPRFSLLSRRQCFGIDERTDASGRVEKKISGSELKRITEKIKKAGADAVAVSLIHAYANPANERAIRKAMEKARFPVSISSDILPEHREYERTAVTAVNAYLLPVMNRYLKTLEKGVQKASLRIMQSNAGHISPAAAGSEPIRTVLSGPAGGVVAAFHAGRAAGFKNIITFDMGGTSTDVSLIDSRIRRTSEGTVGAFPIRLPMIDIHTVGAGGGSIARVDSGGALRVGPRSAGADPGPACYGRGSVPTVTDANLVLGRLVPEFFLGGAMRIDPKRSLHALALLAKKMGKTVLETAEGIVDIANAHMEKAIRVISIERGMDPGRFALFSFGGAGGLHAAEMAGHLKIPKVVVPGNAGVLSALGLLLADSIRDYSLSLLKTAETVKTVGLDRRFAILGKKALQDMVREGFLKKEIRLEYFLDLRYQGQSYEITVPYRKGASFLEAFHREHRKMYAYHHPQRPVEIVNLRVKATGPGRRIRLKRCRPAGQSPAEAFWKKRVLIFKGKKYRAPLYIRSRLKTGNEIKGPALVADVDSTIYLPPSHMLKVDRYLNAVIQKVS